MRDDRVKKKIKSNVFHGATNTTVALQSTKQTDSKAQQSSQDGITGRGDVIPETSPIAHLCTIATTNTQIYTQTSRQSERQTDGQSGLEPYLKVRTLHQAPYLIRGEKRRRRQRSGDGRKRRNVFRIQRQTGRKCDRGQGERGQTEADREAERSRERQREVREEITRACMRQL